MRRFMDQQLERRGWGLLASGLGRECKDVCVGTNKGFTVQYYMDRERRVGDLHGQAPLLWCASALLR
jgi:unsaturated rhamnogalacturonyl hydrolase